MKKLSVVVQTMLAGLILLTAAPAWASFTLVQHPLNASCSSGNATCSVTVSSTGAGHLIVAIAGTNAGTADPISSVSGGGTYTNCSNCSIANSGSGTLDAAYTLNSTSGATSISVTMSSAPSAVWKVEILEYSFTNGPISLDASGSTSNTTSTSSPPGQGLAVAGLNDVIVQAIKVGPNATAISGSYTSPADFSGSYGWAGWVNTITGTAPTWTSSASSQSAVLGIAFTESASGLNAPNTIEGVVGTGSLPGSGVFGGNLLHLLNAPVTGTSIYQLAKLSSNPPRAIITSTTDTQGAIGVVQIEYTGGNTNNTTGVAGIAYGGLAFCTFDGAVTAGDYVQISSTVAGDCHDAGSTYPASGQVLGQVLTTNASAGTYPILWNH